MEIVEIQIRKLDVLNEDVQRVILQKVERDFSGYVRLSYGIENKIWRLVDIQPIYGNVLKEFMIFEKGHVF